MRQGLQYQLQVLRSRGLTIMVLYDEPEYHDDQAIHITAPKSAFIRFLYVTLYPPERRCTGSSLVPSGHRGGFINRTRPSIPTVPIR
jgi:hypothetical protein